MWMGVVRISKSKQIAHKSNSRHFAFRQVPHKSDPVRRLPIRMITARIDGVLEKPLQDYLDETWQYAWRAVAALFFARN
jgi:hypothetical protein